MFSITIKTIQLDLNYILIVFSNNLELTSIFSQHIQINNYFKIIFENDFHIF